MQQTRNREAESQNVSRGGQNLLRGASVLGASMIIVKLIGALFKIPLGNILDGDGMGYFSTSYSIFTMIYSFSTAGLPAAIAKMVAEQSVRGRARDIRRLRQLSVRLFLILGLVGTGLILLLSKVYVNIANNPGAWYCVLAIAPAVFFGCMTSAYRGYYEGLRNMSPTAVSQVVEVVVKLVFGLSLSFGTVVWGNAQFEAGKKVFGVVCKTASEANAAIQPVASAAAILGVTISTMAGTLYLLYKFRRTGDGMSADALRYSPRPMRGRGAGGKAGDDCGADFAVVDRHERRTGSRYRHDHQLFAVRVRSFPRKDERNLSEYPHPGDAGRRVGRQLYLRFLCRVRAVDL